MAVTCPPSSAKHSNTTDRYREIRYGDTPSRSYKLCFTATIRMCMEGAAAVEAPVVSTRMGKTGERGYYIWIWSQTMVSTNRPKAAAPIKHATRLPQHVKHRHTRRLRSLQGPHSSLVRKHLCRDALLHVPETQAGEGIRLQIRHMVPRLSHLRALRAQTPFMKPRCGVSSFGESSLFITLAA